MMGTGAISLSVALVLVSPSVSSLSIVSGIFGASVTLPCDGSAYRGAPDDQLDVLWQTSEGKKVANFSRGVHSISLQFEQRVTLLTERIQRGDFSLTISSVDFRDEDTYECVWRKGQDGQKYLSDVTLQVLEPQFSKNLSIPVGDSVTLPCYAHINKHMPGNFIVHWKRGDELVLQRSSEEVTYGPVYEKRALVSPDMIKKGNFSLYLNVTGLRDSGVYQCSTDMDQSLTSVTLNLTDYRHFEQVSLSLGMPFYISLPPGPVEVLFSNGSTFPSVRLCSVYTDGFWCEPKYQSRMKWNSNILTMLDMTSDDVGTYTVVHSKNFVISHAYIVNITRSNNNDNFFSFLVLIVIALGLVYYVLRKHKCVKDVKKKISEWNGFLWSPEHAPQHGTHNSESAKMLLESTDMQSPYSIINVSGMVEDPYSMSESSTEDDSEDESLHCARWNFDSLWVWSMLSPAVQKKSDQRVHRAAGRTMDPRFGDAFVSHTEQL